MRRLLVATLLLFSTVETHSMILIESDMSSLANANTRVKIDVRDERIAGNVYGSLQGTFPLPNGFSADRWYYGWWGKDDEGDVVFEWRLDNAGPPSWPLASVLTAVRTRTGPATIGNMTNPHSGQPSIWRWYTQIGRMIRFRGASEIALYDEKDTNNHPKVYDLLSRTNLLTGESVTQRAIDGSAPLVPPELARIVYLRGEVTRKPGTGAGLAQVTYAPHPKPAWDTTGSPVFGSFAKGYASEQPPGHVAVEPHIPALHTPGTGKIAAYIEANTLASTLVMGFEILPEPVTYEDAGGEPDPLNDEDTVLFVTRDGSTYTDTSSGGAGSPHTVSSGLIADHADFDLGDDDFAIIVRATPSSFSAQMTPASQWEASGGGNRAWCFNVNTDRSVSVNVRVGGDTGGITLASGANAVSDGIEFEAVLQRVDDVLELWINGTKADDAAITAAVNNSSRAIMIGGLHGNGGSGVVNPWSGTVQHLSIHHAARK